MSQPQYPQPYADPRSAKAQAAAEKAYRKAQRPWYKKKRFILPLALFVLIVLIVSLSSGGGSNGTPSTAGSPTSAAKDPAAPPAFPGATENDVVAQAGESVTTDSKITMTSTQLVKGKSTFEKTLCTSVSYQNGSDEPASFNGGFDWKLQDPNGAILMNTFTGSDKALNSGQLAPGGKTSGDVCFKAPDGNPSGQYVVLLDPSFRFASDRIAWLNTL